MSRVNERSYVIAYHNKGNNASLNCKHCEIKFFISHHGFITKTKYNTKGRAMQAAKPSASKNSFLLIPNISSYLTFNYNIVCSAIANACRKIIITMFTDSPCFGIMCHDC